MGVPYYAYTDDRDMLSAWAEKKGDEGLKQYWEEKNQFSIDNIPTNILTKNSLPLGRKLPLDKDY